MPETTNSPVLPVFCPLDPQTQRLRDPVAWFIGPRMLALALDAVGAPPHLDRGAVVVEA